MGKGPSQQTQDTQTQLTQQQMDLAQQQNARSQQLFDLSLPGYKTAENFYQELASGNPSLIATALAPANAQITQNTEATKKNILQNTPRGGVQELGLQEADIAGESQRSLLGSEAYMSAFPALANLAGSTGGLSVNTVANAIASFGGASSSNQALAQQQQASKESTLGFAGGLLGDAAMIGSTVLTGGAAAPAAAAAGGK